METKSAISGLDAIRKRRKDLIPLLQKAQATDGFLSPRAIADISRTLKVSENEIYGVATFYTQFRFRPPGQYNVKVCLGTACHVGGGQNFMEVMKIGQEPEPRRDLAGRKVQPGTSRLFGMLRAGPRGRRQRRGPRPDEPGHLHQTPGNSRSAFARGLGPGDL